MQDLLHNLCCCYSLSGVGQADDQIAPCSLGGARAAAMARTYTRRNSWTEGLKRLPFSWPVPEAIRTMHEFERTRYQCHISAHNKCFNGDAKVMLLFSSWLYSPAISALKKERFHAKLDPPFKTAFKTWISSFIHFWRGWSPSVVLVWFNPCFRKEWLKMVSTWLMFLNKILTQSIVRKNSASNFFCS